LVDQFFRIRKNDKIRVALCQIPYRIKQRADCLVRRGRLSFPRIDQFLNRFVFDAWRSFQAEADLAVITHVDADAIWFGSLV